MKKTLSATFHLTHQCNLRCDYCYTGEKLPISMAQKTVDASIGFVLKEAKENNIDRLQITFFGGEPLLEKEHIFYIIDQLESRKEAVAITYGMSTNGTLITEELMQQLAEKRVFVSLSMDGNPETNDMHRPLAGGQGSSKKVMQAAKIMLKHNPATNVNCVITPASAAQLTNSVDWIFSLGFKYITTTLDYSADWSVDDFKTLKRSYKKLAKWYEAKMIAEERFYLSFFDERIRTRTLPPLTKNERCFIGQKQFSIAPDGALYPCIQFVTTEGLPEYIIGHVEHGFDKTCQHHISCCSEKPKPECQGCMLESRCSKWCSCINFMSTGSIEKVSPVVCYNEKILIEIVDKTADRLWKKRNNMFVHKHYNPDYPIISHIEINL